MAATYIAETVDTFAPAGDPADLIYRLLDRAAESLLARGNAQRVVAYVEIWMLRLAGIFPSRRDCMQCGQPIGRPLRFDAKLEGFVCETCATRDSFIVPNEVADELDLIGKIPIGEYASRPGSFEAVFEVRSLAGAVRRNFLGHELKSFEVLASIAAG